MKSKKLGDKTYYSSDLQDPREALIVSLKREVNILHQENNHLRVKPAFHHRHLSDKCLLGNEHVVLCVLWVRLSKGENCGIL